MPSLAEALSGATPLAAALQASLDSIDEFQSISFTQYTRTVIPVDGYIFWLKTTNTQVFEGSLHYASQLVQAEDEYCNTNSVIFTSKTLIQDFAAVDPTTLWIAVVSGVTFAFSRRGPFFIQAGLYHYAGESVVPSMRAQIIDDPSTFDFTSQVVTNSLPLWLAMMGVTNTTVGLGGIGINLFPGFLPPQNEPAAYAIISVIPEGTEPLTLAPRFDPTTSSQNQLCTDRVRITLAGVRNAEALYFLDYISRYALFTDYFGYLTPPVLRDQQVPQAELGTLSMKKTIDFTINYYQGTARMVAMQLIERALIQVTAWPVEILTGADGSVLLGKDNDILSSVPRYSYLNPVTGT